MPYFNFPESAKYVENTLDKYKEKSSVVNVLANLLPDPYDVGSYLIPIGNISKGLPKNAASLFGEITRPLRDIHGGKWSTNRLRIVLEEWVEKLSESPEKKKAIKYLNEYYAGKEIPEVSLEVAAEWVHEALRKMGLK